jgi:hypothetical protein
VNSAGFSLFLLAAPMIAVVPGPGIFYVAARTLSGGRRAGEKMPRPIRIEPVGHGTPERGTRSGTRQEQHSCHLASSRSGVATPPFALRLPW